MTVRDLIEVLEQYDDAEVKIGMFQNYGTGWAVEIPEVAPYKYHDHYDRKENKVVFLIQGKQIGGISEECDIDDMDNEDKEDK